VYRATYIPGEAFIVHLPRFNLEFERTGKLYMANFSDLTTPPLHHVCATVQENESIYTHTEIHRAKEAYEFLKI
jgi:hypothetical protein